MDTIEKLNKAKASLKGGISRIETFVDKPLKDTSKTELEVKLESIYRLQRKAEELRERSYGLEKVPSAELTEFENDMDECESRLEGIEVRIKIIIKSMKNSLPKTNIDQNETETPIVNTKIPPILLPTFSGKHEQYCTFKNQFDDLITLNEQLTESQKLYYLNTCLQDEVKEFASTFDTFSSLYKALESRYDNKRLIVDIHVESILNFKKIERENATEIREMIDCINKTLRALKVLKYEQNELFNIFLLNIMLKKLDRESRKNFELIQKTKDVPTFEQFMTFLEQREAVLLSVSRNCVTENKTIMKKPPNFPTKGRTLLVNEDKKNKSCIVCLEITSHPIYRCTKFLQLTPQKRFELVRLHKLCELCLRKNHKT